MEALGRLLNTIPTADAAWVSMAECEAVTFLCVGADTYTVQDASDAAGTGAANLSSIDNYWTNTSAVGAAAWAAATQAKGAAITVAGAVGVFTVEAAQLRDGFKYVRCSSAAAGLVVAITHDLIVQRAPNRYAALAA